MGLLTQKKEAPQIMQVPMTNLTHESLPFQTEYSFEVLCKIYEGGMRIDEKYVGKTSKE